MIWGLGPGGLDPGIPSLLTAVTKGPNGPKGGLLQ